VTYNQFNTFPYRESVLKGGVVFAENVQKSAYVIIAMTHLAEGLCRKRAAYAERRTFILFAV
jgi:hypothetical protein